MPRRCAVSALVVVALTLPAYGQEVKLEWKLKEGDKFFLETTTTLNQAVKVGGQDVKQGTEQTVVSSFTVKKKEADGSLLLEQKFESVRLKVTGTEVDPKAAQALEGAAFTFTLDPKGELTRFHGFDDVVKKISQDNPAVGKDVRKVLTDDFLKVMAQEAFGFLPDKAVKKGDKWERKFVYPLGPLGTLTSTNKYTYAGKEKVDGKELDKITAELSIAYTPPAPQPSAPFTITKGDVKAEGAKATIYFDSAAGRLVRAESTLPLKGTLTLNAMGRDTEMDLTQQQTIKDRVLDKAPAAK